MTHDQKIEAIKHAAKHAIQHLVMSQDAKRHFEEARVVDTPRGFALYWGKEQGHQAYFDVHEI